MIEIINYDKVLQDNAGTSQYTWDWLDRFEADVRNLPGFHLVPVHSYVHDAIILEIVPQEQTILNDVIPRGCPS